MQNGEPRFRGAACLDRRPFDARRIAAVVAVLPGAVPDPRRPESMGHAGDRRISARDQSGSRAVAGRSDAARPLPLDLRRDAFRLFQSALGAADEYQGAFPAVSNPGPARAATSSASPRSGANASAQYGGPYLFGKKPCAADAMYAPVCSRFVTYDVPLDPVRRPTAAPSWRCRSCRNGSPAPKPSPTSSRSSTSSSDAIASRGRRLSVPAI